MVDTLNDGKWYKYIVCNMNNDDKIEGGGVGGGGVLVIDF